MTHNIYIQRFKHNTNSYVKRLASKKIKFLYSHVTPLHSKTDTADPRGHRPVSRCTRLPASKQSLFVLRTTIYKVRNNMWVQSHIILMFQQQPGVMPRYHINTFSVWKLGFILRRNQSQAALTTCVYGERQVLSSTGLDCTCSYCSPLGLNR